MTAQFSGPHALTFAGALYIADTGNDAIRVVTVALQLDRITPTRGTTAGGTQLRLYGAGFVAGETRVSVGGATVQDVVHISSAELLVSTPAHAAGAADVVVSTNGGTATLVGAYTYVAPPGITAVSPAKGRTAGGEAVTVTGAAFDADTEFFFGSAPALRPIITDATSASVMTPPGVHGAVDVVVRTSGGEARLANGFRYWAAPAIFGFTPPSGAEGTLVTVTGSAFDPDAAGNLVRFGAVPAVVISATETSLVTAVPPGAASAPIFITTAGGTAHSTTAFIVPVLTAIAVEPAASEIEPGGTQQFSARAAWSDGGSTDVTTAVAWSSSSDGVATITTGGLARGVGAGAATIEAALNGITATARLTVRSTEPLPSDPATIAPATDRMIAQSFDDTTKFLYSAADPVQTGVAAGTIDARRAAVVRGRVLTRQGEPLGGATVTVAGHPELGQTLSRADGMYDLAVNGGSRLTVRYERAGHLPIERQRYVGWNDFAVIEDVVLTPLDANVTTIASGSPSPQMARGGRVVDTDGARQATVLFPARTTATLVMPDGSTQAAMALNVRATEYTVGSTGAQAMPAELPPASAYTYCVELSADEAIVAGASEVRFSNPVAVYVENFLGFRVGGVVPSGYYDRGRGTWIAAPNGRIVRITAISNGMADLDVTGDGFPDAGSTLTNLGIDDAERRQLATLYTAGQSLWRVPVTHFTPWDFNWPYGVPFDAVPPSLSEPGEDPGPVEISPPAAEPDLDDPVVKCGSVIECENRGLGEAAPITGTPWTLNYRSHRTEGRSGRYTLSIQLTGAEIPPGVKRVELEIQVAGQRVRETFPPEPNLTYRYTWNGRNAYGQQLEGGMNPQIHVGYSYDLVYQGPYAFGLSFGRVSNTRDTLRLGRMDVTLWQTLNVEAPQQSGASLRGAWTNKAAALGGWSLSAQHAYDPRYQVLYLGSGAQRNAQPVMAPFAGSLRKYGYRGDGGAATEAFLNEPESVAVAPDGTVYIADSLNFVIRKVKPSGQISTFAGMPGRSGRSPGAVVGDGGPATSAELVYPWDVEIADGGTLYIVDHATIRKVTPDGTISTVAGTNTWSGAGEGDGGPATQAKISPRGMTLGPDGTLYFLDGYGIRQVSNGTITTLHRRFDSQTGYIISGFDIASGTDGSLYFVASTPQGTQGVVRRWPDGRVSTVAAGADDPSGLVAARDGSIYYSSRSGGLVKHVTPEGSIVTVAGGGSGSNDPYAPPTSVGLGTSWLGRIAFGPDGALYIADGNNSLIRKVEPSLPGGVLPDGGRIVSADGSEVYIFDGNGRHLSTLGRNGEPRLQFRYDTVGRLLSVTDVDGNTTTIERDEEGVPVEIVAPGGQRTTVTLDDNGYLAAVTNPAGETRGYSYTETGLLLSYRDPRGKRHSYTYDDGGSLTEDTAPDGGTKTLRFFEENRERTTTFTTAEGRSERISVLRLKSGALRRTVVDAAGRTTIAHAGTDGTTTVTGPDGSVIVTREKPDPRYGMHAPLLAEQTLTLPSGLRWSQTASRTAVVSDPAKPFTLQSETEISTINGRQYAVTYAAAARTSTARTPDGRISTTTFDQIGRTLRHEVAGLTALNLSYESGLLSSMSQGTRATTFTYNARRELITLKDALGRRVAYQYDPAGRVTRQTMPDGRSVGFSYDAAGNLTSVTPPGRPPHSLGYSALSLVDDYSPPPVAGSGATSYAYNRDRQLISVSRPDGKTIALTYDSAGRLATIGGSVSAYTFGYLSGGQLGTIEHAGEQLTFTRDGPLVTGVTAAGTVAGSIGWTWNNELWVTAELVNGSSIAFGYDQDGLLTSAGTLELKRHPSNGLLTGTALGKITDAWSYNSFGEVTSYSAAYDGTPLLSFNYTRDDGGRITSIGRRAFEYDDSGRLVRVTSGGSPVAEYDYDTNSNRIAHRTVGGTTTSAYDEQDRLLMSGDNSYEYAANGELQAMTVGGTTTTFDYDAIGNLRKVEIPGRTINYVIDGQNRRVGKKVNGTLTQGWLYEDQLRIVAELDGANHVVSRFVYGSRTNVPDYMVKAGVTYRILSDHLGSPRLVVNTTDGTIAQQLDYDEFGRVLTDSAPGFQPFGFAGGLYDRDTGLLRFGMRDYDPRTGRWTIKDPSGFEGGDANLYAYVFGDPVNFFDPAGLDAVTSDATVRQYFYDLWRQSAYGNDRRERSSWITQDPATGQYGCVKWPWSAKDRSETWRGPRPKDYVAIAHTHPNPPIADPKPSTGGEHTDDVAARKINGPVYTINRKGIWKVDPQGKITQEEGPEWHNNIDAKKCAPCK